MAKAGFEPPVHFVETSPRLRDLQAAAVPGATFHDSVDSLPTTEALIVVANEFFDALPIRQLVRRGAKDQGGGWHERLVACQDTLFLPIAGKPVPLEVLPEPLRDAPAGSVLEISPASVTVMTTVARRIAAQGGAMLAIDYGYEGPALGDTLQAVRGHGFANPFDTPGTVDLSAHVDFTTLAAAAQGAGAVAWGPISQRDLLGGLGIDTRATALARATPDKAEAILADRARLMSDMGTLFRALAVTRADWPVPAAFGA